MTAEQDNPSTAAEESTEDLQHAMVAGLMSVIGAPDDVEVAEAGNEIVRKLDVALRAAAAAA
jgi:hypothetical protein